MKIGLVCPYNINKHGGVLEVVLHLRDGLEQRGHQVKIITPQPRSHDEEPPDGVIFAGTSIDFRSPAHTTTQISSRHEEEGIDAMLEAEQFDVLHFHEPWVPLLSRQLLQRSRCVNIATFHSKVPETIVARSVIKVVNPYMKSVLQYLHVLTAVSPSGAEYAASMTDQPITIIPNGIDLDKYKHKPVNRPERAERIILYIGRLERRKGVRYLLQAFQLLEQDHPDLRLIIAGDGNERERLELLSEDLKLKRVDFLGFISEDLKLKLLAEADMFCSPAVFGESFGIVLLEAMASGTVTVAGNNSGYSELMQGIGSLSIVNPEDTVEFARRLDMLLSLPELRELWQAWAKDYVQQFSYPKVVSQYEDLYKEAVEQYGGRA